MKKTTVLCTSVGNDGFPAVLAGLRQREGVRIVGGDANPETVGLRLADIGIVLPRRDEQEALILALQEAIARYNVDVILPLSTDDQPFFGKYISKFLGTQVAVSTLDSIQRASDKHLLYQHAHSIGVSTPRFAIIESNQGLVSALRAYSSRKERCVIKKSHGTGAQGVKVVNPALTFADRFWSRDNIEISDEEAISWANMNQLTQPILVSDYLPGEHLSVDGFRSRNGNFHAVVRTEKSHLYGGGVVGRTIYEPHLLEVTERLVESLGLLYAFNVEYKRDQAGKPRLLEINPRFGASVGHSIAAGFNFPLMVVDEASGRTIPQKKAGIGVEFRRYWAHATWTTQDS